MENWCWNIRKIKKTGQGLPEELGKYIWLTEADTSQEAPASKSGSSSHETEKHILVPGDILHFDGVNFINGAALEDSEVSVTLIKK